MSNGHWTSELVIDPSKYFGFIYLITDTSTGKMYVGKKQYWSSQKSKVKGCKTCSNDKASPKWKSQCWKESNWRVYKGSSKELTKWMKANPKNDYKYEIIHQCRSRGVLHYMELKELWARDVLDKKNPEGNHIYFNRAIGAIKFRPPAYMSEDARTKQSEAHEGEKSARLNKQQVIEIVKLLPAKSNQEIATLYDCSSLSISKIRTGRTWKSIPRQES